MSVFERIRKSNDFSAPNDWIEIETIDMHTGGEPLRVVISGYPEIEGNSILERRAYLRNHLDHIRKQLMFEPRGHADMYGCILVPPNDDTADFGIIFMHNEGYSTMCGHAIIAISTLVFQMGWKENVEGRNNLEIDAPCGRIKSFIEIQKGEVQQVSFHCVPSFVVSYKNQIEIKGIGRVEYDLAYGGAFYAYVDLAKNSLALNLEKSSYGDLVNVGRQIKQAIIASGKEIIHPFESDLSFLYGVIFIDASDKVEIHSKNVCVFADGEIDRCPTGSGVSGRMAIHYFRDEVKLDESIKIESITGSVFEGSVVDTVSYGSYDAVVPCVKGTAFITGVHKFVVDPKDDMKDGFLLR